MRTRLAVVLSGVILLASVSPVAAAETSGNPAASAPVVVLDTTGFWRMHHTVKGPVVDMDGTLTTVVPTGSAGRAAPFYEGLLAPATPAPPEDWRMPGFDDSGWGRGPARRACRAPHLARLCLRGKFTVSDPAKVKGLTLSVGYHGGAVVSVNGTELARQHVPAGPLGADTVAEAYPLDVYVNAGGKLLGVRGDLWDKQKVDEDSAQRIRRRERTLSAEVPAGLLRKGVNVVAVELIRAPYHKVVDEQKALLKAHGQWSVHDFSWNTCEIRRVRLTASAADGLVPGAVRPQGLQVWNSDPLAVDFDMDFGDPTEVLQPIRLVGARNGCYSGKVVLGSSETIRGLAAKAGDLKGAGGTIPASQVRVRYGMPWGNVILTNSDNYEAIPYPAAVDPLLALYDAAPAEIPVRPKEVTAECLTAPGQPTPLFGAVVSVWVTLKVPKSAKPGTYTGEVTLTAQSETPVTVAVVLKIVDWALPDPRELQTWVELVQSPDTLVLEYGVEPWSDRHLELIGTSMDTLRAVGSRVLYVPLIAQTNVGNEHSMVRWIPRGEDRYEYDFSVMEKYLDVAEAHMGKPQIVVFNVWDRYLIREGSGGRDFQVKKGLKVAIGGPLVTVVDPATGKAENVCLPAYVDARSKALWKPLFDQLRVRMKRRGLEKAMMIGMASDFWATRQQAEFLKDVTADLPWVNAGHYVRKSLHDLAGFGYQASFFGVHFGFGESRHGWKEPALNVLFERVGLDYYPMTKWRRLAEQAITGNVRGVGRLGADTWLSVKDKHGKRVGRAWQRYPAANWGYLNVNSSVLAPAPDGPVATMRFEMLREGIQECEALIAIERALTDADLKKALSEDLVRRCEEALDERRRCLWRSFITWQSGPKYSHDVRSWRGRGQITGYTWFLGSGWQERSEKLYALAGEVARTRSRK